MQYVSIAHSYPDIKIIWKTNKITCLFIVKPTPLSREYKIRLIFDGNKPSVYLLGSDIIGIERNDFPHHFEIDKDKHWVRLCLYYAGDWYSTMSISDTIIPWTVEWLFHYEIWLTTGVWNGGGKHPKQSK